jgi:hypothetical protein
VTRPGRSSRGLAALFARDPYAAVQRIVRDARDFVTAVDIKRALAAAGAPALDKQEWDPLQRLLRSDVHVEVEPGRPYRYRWIASPPSPSVAEAVDHLIRAAGNRTKAAYADVVRQALTTPSAAPSTAPRTAGKDGRKESREDAARRRQAVLDGVRALAELASEVEELTANEASGRALIHRVRGRVKLSGLEPIERAGETVTFDRRRHESIGPPIADGARVVVVRPGYAWKTADEDVLVARAVVQD